MPSGWSDDLGVDFHGRVEYRRFFNKSTGIGNTTPVAVAATCIVGNAKVFLNDLQLGVVNWPTTRGRWSVTGSLLPRNEIRIEITSLDDVTRADAFERFGDVGLVGEVSIEIG